MRRGRNKLIAIISIFIILCSLQIINAQVFNNGVFNSLIFPNTEDRIEPVDSSFGFYTQQDYDWDGELLPDGVLCLDNQILKKTTADDWDCAEDEDTTDHGLLSGLSDDDHTQYALLAGRSGGQTLIGGTDASDYLIFNSTSNASKGRIIFGNETTGMIFDEDDNAATIGGGSNQHTVNGSVENCLWEFHQDGSTGGGGTVYHRHTNTASLSSDIVFLRSRGDHDTQTAVQDGDQLGHIKFAGHDGTDHALSADIGIYVDGTPGNDVMPGMIFLSTTPPGSQTPVENIIVHSDGSTSFEDNNITAVSDIGLKSITGVDAGSMFTITTDWTNAGNTVADLGSITTVDINGGTIDNTSLGASTPSTGIFSDLTTTNTHGLVIPATDTYAYTRNGDPDTGAYFNVTGLAFEWHRDSNTQMSVGAVIGQGDLDVERDVFAGRDLYSGRDLYIGDGRAGNRMITFDGENTDGLIVWLDTSDALAFYDEMFLNNGEKFYFRGTTTGIWSQATNYLDLFGSSAIRIGDSSAGAPTNYTNFSSTGYQTMVGNARVSKEFELTATDFTPGASGATEVNVGNYHAWSFGIGDDIISDFEIPHDWDSSTDLSIVIYWAINEAYATNNGEVQWRIQWSATPADSTEAINAPTHTGTIDYGDQNIPATAYYLTQSSSGTISSASLSAGDLIGITLDRVALDDGSNPAAEPLVLHIEVHYTSNKLGETL